MGTLDQLLGRLDPDPNRRGDQWGRIVEWYLRHDPIYAHELRRVWRTAAILTGNTRCR